MAYQFNAEVDKVFMILYAFSFVFALFRYIICVCMIRVCTC